jgi:ABC-type sugar transport system substrate-binding protein
MLTKLRSLFSVFAFGASAAGIFAVNLGLTAVSVTAEPLKIAYIPANQTSTWHQATRKAGEFFAATQDVELIVLDPNDDTHEQLRMAREIAGQVSAAIFVPVSSGSFQVAKIFKSTNPTMPVLAIDRDAPSDQIDLFIAFGSKEAGARVAERGVELLGKQKGQVAGKVLVVTGDLTSVAGVDRRDGMLEVLKKHPGLTVAGVLEAKKWLPADAQQKIEAALNAFGKPDMVLSGFEGGTQAAVNALQRKGWISPPGSPEHVVIGSIDTGSSVLDGIRTKKVDFTVDQPNLFYLPVAILYVKRMLQEGRGALPRVGEVLTADGLPIHSLASRSDRKELWSNPFWAPGKVEMSGATKHLQVKMEGLLVDSGNVDAPYLYANVTGVGK